MIGAGPLSDLLANAKLGSNFGMIFTGNLSMHSLICTAGKNFGLSFDPWQQLRQLAYFEANLQKGLDQRSLNLNAELQAFRYLYLGKFFSMEHQCRSARSNPVLMASLRALSDKILAEYVLQLNQLGIQSTEEMLSKDFLAYAFRNPVRRIFKRLKNRLFQILDVSL